MSHPGELLQDEGEQVRKAQHGDLDALTALRHQHNPALVNILLARGASHIEAEDIVADLWHDCVPGVSDKPPLLTKFGGKFSLLSWLARVAGNRWIDLKRRGAKHASAEEPDFDDMPGRPVVLEDDLLAGLLRESLKAAFARCSGSGIIMLRLVYLHGLTQREVGNMVGWSQTKTSRVLSDAMDQIKINTLKEIKRRDVRLELAWEDFLGLCGGEGADFL